MRISDWSSDVCSSDLLAAAEPVGQGRTARDELERHRVDAVAQAGRRRAVGEDMALVAATARAGRLDADHAVGPVFDAGDRKSVVSGKRVSVRVDLGCRRIIKKTQNKNIDNE